MKSLIVLLLFALACNNSDEPAPKSESEQVAVPPPKDVPDTTVPAKPAAKPAEPSEPAPKVEEPKAQTAVSGTLRLVIIDPDPAIVRKRKKRTDSKGDLKKRERNLKKQQKRIADLAEALGKELKVKRVKGDEAEQLFMSGLTMGTENANPLPAAWGEVESILVLVLAPGTDLTKNSGGFIGTGTSKVALFHPPDTIPVYLESASEGMEVDTAELAKIALESKP